MTNTISTLAKKCRLYPTKEDRHLLSQHFGLSRKVWNIFLDRCLEQYNEAGKTPSHFDMCSTLAELKRKKEYDYLNNAYINTLQHTLGNLVRAFNNLKAGRAKMPKHKLRSLAPKLQKIGLGEFRRQLQYKAPLMGRRCIVIDRWFPSSKMCGSCGNLNSDLTLADRVWTCDCGTTHDRDVNAALNIRNEGLRIIRAEGVPVLGTT